jgi:hypothetical protein
MMDVKILVLAIGPDLQAGELVAAYAQNHGPMGTEVTFAALDGMTAYRGRFPLTAIKDVRDLLSDPERWSTILVVTGTFEHHPTQSGAAPATDLPKIPELEHLSNPSREHMHIILCSAMNYDGPFMISAPVVPEYGGSFWQASSVSGLMSVLKFIFRTDRTLAYAYLVEQTTVARDRLSDHDSLIEIRTQKVASPELLAARSPRRLFGLRRLISSQSTIGVESVGATFRRLPALLNWFGWWRNPTLGEQVQVEGAEPLARDLQCTVLAPPSARSAEEVLIQAMFHEAGDQEEQRAVTLAAAADPQAQLRSALQLGTLPEKEEIEVRVSGEGLHLDEPVKTFVWHGRMTPVSFTARVTKEAGARIVARVLVLYRGAPLGSAHFTIDVTEAPASGFREARLARYRTAFLSYASPDRTKVMHHYHLLRRIGCDVFQDVMDLDPGERWERKLYERIDDTDLFLLYWSSAAAKSEWVRREAEYALARQSEAQGERPDIVPMLLEGPPPPPVPPSLAQIHMNDPLRYVIAAQEAADATMTHALK